MIDDELKDDIIEEIYLNDNPDWIGLRLPNLDEINKCACAEIEVKPEGAKTIDEIESFTVMQHIMGAQFYQYKRRT